MTPSRCTQKIALLVTWFFFLAVGLFFTLQMRTQNVLIENLKEQLNQQDQYPLPLASSDDPHGDRSLFTFSPDKKSIVFIKNVFTKYGEDYDRYWALVVFDPATRKEQELLVDDSHLSEYEWLSTEVIRVYHSGGTGVRVYRDVSIGDTPVFFKDSKYTSKHTNFWISDEKYTAQTIDAQEAERIVSEK